MSYDDDRRGGYGQSDPREYGGGGRGGDNYYDQSEQFNDNEQSGGLGRQGGARGVEEYGERRQEGGYGRGDEYGGRQGGGRDEYSGGQVGGYGDEPPRHHGRREDNEGGYGGTDRYGQEGRRPEGYGASGGQGGYGEERRHEGRQNEGYGSNEGTGYGGDGGYGGSSTGFDQDEVLRHTQQHGNSGDSDLFSTALSFLGNNKHSAQSEDIDEGRLQQSHQQLYQQGGGNQQHDASSLGAGAAMQALKMFSGGAGGTVGSGSQSQMIALAMQEGSKLFDKQSNQGNVQSGTDKQSDINQAAKFALQMYLKSNQGPGGGSGGAGGLLSLAGKFFQ